MQPQQSKPTDNISNYRENLLYRSQIIWFGELTAEILGGYDPSANSFQLNLQGNILPFNNLRPLTNAGFESAAINVRAIFKFLGLDVDYKLKRIIGRKKVSSTDVVIEDFGGAPVSVAHFETTLQSKEPTIKNEDVAVCLNAANKAVAHLTRHPLDGVTIERSRATCHCTNVLLQEALSPLGFSLPIPATLRRAAF